MYNCSYKPASAYENQRRINTLYLNEDGLSPSQHHYSPIKFTYMKKMLTLLFAVGCMTAAMAQSHHNDYGRNDKRPGDRRVDNSYNNYLRERDAQIARINFHYNAMIRDVNANRYLRSNKKRNQIKQLERERARQIDAVMARYSRGNYGNSYAYGRH